MTRFCPTCGTEIDESALFCPSCGQPIAPLPDADEVAAEPATAAPPPEPSVARTEPHPRSAAQEPGAPPPPASAAAPAAGGSQVNVPVTWPVMLSGWLIGGGAVLGAVGALLGLFGGLTNAIDVLLLVALIGVAATVFFSASIPAVPHLRLITLGIALVGFGMALDRIGYGVASLGTLLVFLGTAAMAIGAVLLELGRDQPLGGPGT
jgi:hypothetical protein